MNSRPLVTVFEFENNKRLYDIADAKWQEKWLNPEEYIAVKRSLWQNINDTIFQSNILRWQVEVKIINILEGQNIPALSDIPGDAFIFWWFPGAWKDETGLEDKLKSVVFDIVDRKQKPFLWICFWHQLLAQAFWWTLKVMDKSIIWPRVFKLNRTWLEDSIFAQLKERHVWSIFWHKRMVENIWQETDVLAKTPDWVYQAIRVWEKARWIQWHPEFSVAWTKWRIKLWRSNFTKTWNDPDKVLWKFEGNWFTNTSNGLIEAYLKDIVK